MRMKKADSIPRLLAILRRAILLTSLLLATSVLMAQTHQPAQTSAFEATPRGARAVAQRSGISTENDQGTAKTSSPSSPFIPVSNCSLTPPANHSALCVVKDGNGDPALTWSGGGPFDLVTATDSPFTQNVETVLEATPANMYTYASDGATPRRFFSIADRSQNENTAAVYGIGSNPPLPPVVNNVNPRYGWVGDTVVVNGDNYDLIPTRNNAYYNQLPAAITGGTKTTLNVVIPKGAAAAGVVACAHTLCTSASPYNGDVLALDDANITGISSIAADDARDGGGAYKMWVADSATSSIYQTDLEVRLGNPQAIVSGTVMQPVIPTATLSDGSIPYVSRGLAPISDFIHFLTRAGADTVFGATHDMDTQTCHGVLESTPPNVTGITISPFELPASTNKNVYLCDTNTNYIRRVQQGAVLTGSGNQIDASYSGQSFGSFSNPCAIVGWPNLGELNAFSNAGAFYNVNVSSCAGTSSTYLGNRGTGVRGYTTNELFNYSWYYRGFNSATFAQEKTTHYGFVPIATASRIIRAQDPELFIQPFNPTKVMISTKQGGVYPSTNQTVDGQIRIDVNGRPNSTAYLRIIDPLDTSAYASFPAPPACVAIGNSPCDWTGQINDNRSWNDTGGDGYGFDAGPFFNKTMTLNIGGSGLASVTLYITKRYSGDNYKIQASYQDFINPASPGYANAHIKVESGMLTAWKRVYTERDRMFRKGGVLFENFNVPAGSCGANCNKIKVYNWANVMKDDQIVVFDEFITSENGGEVARVIADPIVDPGGFLILTLDVNLTKSYFGAVSTTGGQPNFSDHSGGIGVKGHYGAGNALTICDDQFNGPGGCYFYADPRILQNSYNDVFVQFNMVASPADNSLPYVHILNVNGTTLGNLQARWFANIGKTNYLHLVGAEENPGNFAQGGATPYPPAGGPYFGATFIWEGRIEINFPALAAVVNQYTCVHEVAHNIAIQGVTDQTYHCNNPSYNPPADGHTCIMLATFVVYVNDFPRFCKEHMLTGGATLTDIQVSIRDQVDQLP